MKNSTFSAQVANNLLTVLQGYTKGIRFVVVLTMLLTLGVANAWAETYSWTCSGTTVFSTSGSSLNGVTWKATTSGSSQGTGVSGEKCVQIAKNTGLTLETTAFNNKNIASISIQTWGSQGNTFYLEDGNTQLKSTTIPKSYTSNGAKISFSNVGVIGTELVFNWASATKAFNVRSITITYEDAVSSCSVKPTVGTTLQSVTATENSIKATISISSIGGCDITENGLVYSTTNATPTVGGSGCYKVTTTACGSTAANKTVTITGLTCGQSYNIRGYATNEAGTSYTNVTTESTSDCPKYTVTLVPGSGSVTNTVLEEPNAGEGVTLPTPTLDCGDWEFAGWKTTSAVTTETTTEPTLIPAGAYSPTSDITLYAVYQRTEGGGGEPTAYSAGDEGDFVIASYNTSNSKWYAIPETPTLSSSKIAGVEITVSQTAGDVNYVSTANAEGYTWTIADATNGQTISDGSKYIYHSNGGSSGTNLAYGTSTSYTWKIEKENNGLTFKGMNGSTTNSRGLLFNGSVFGGYALSNEDASGYYRIQVLPIGGGSTTYYHSTPDCGSTASTYTLTLHSGLSCVTDGSATVELNATELTNFIPATRDGFTCSGYWSAPSGGVQVLNADGTFAATSVQEYITDGKWTNEGNVTLTPHWECSNTMTLSVGTQSGGTYSLSKTSLETCDCTDNKRQVTITATPNSGYSVTDISYSGDGTATKVSGPTVNGNNTEWVYQFNQGDKGIGTFTVTFTVIPTYTVTWMVNGEELKSGGGGDTFTTNITGGNSILDLPDEPDAPAGCSTKVFVGWTTEPIDSVADTPPSELFDVLGDFPAVTEDVTYYAVWADEEGGGSEGWILTDIANIESDDAVVITMTTNEGTTYALSSANGSSSAPAAPTLTVDGNKLSSIIADAVKWNISNDNGNLTIYPNGTTAKWLYCTNNNDGVRVGTGTNKTFTITSGYLKNTGQNRYVGVYTTNPDWRCYTSTSTNIGDQTLGFYTYQSSTTYSAYTTICDNTKATITYNLDGGTGATCEKTTVTKGEEFTLCSQTPTKEGYHFAGWSDGTRTYAAGDNVTVDDHTTFYASWNPKSITITWDQNYTDCPEAATSTYIYDGEGIEIPADPTRVGYKFTGWFTASPDGTQVTEVGETNKPTADVIYYAHWAELYTVTFRASGQVYAKQEFKYLSGATLQLPADPSAANYACDGYIFDGWSETEKTNEDATKPTLISTPAITKDETYYAVWKKATTEGAGEEIFYESFKDCDGTGGNDGTWSGSIATSTAYVDNDGWVGDNFSGAYQCMKLGSGSKKGYITTPTLSQLSGNATLSFKAAAWNGSDEKTTLRLSIEGGGSLSQTSVTLKKGAWQTYELTITGGTSNTKITFAGYQASDSRFFLDEVKVATSGSYNYTTSPSCGPTIVAKEGMWVTSSNGQSVKVNVPIAVKSFTNNATLTGTTANENFVVTPLDNVGNGEHNVVVTYTPNAYDTKEDATITLTAKDGETVITTTTFTLNGRSLPEAFAVVVDKASTYFALPANMPEAGVYPGFNVSLNADKSAVVAAPKTHLYALKTVHKNRLDENGTCVRLEGNNTACLWSTNAASGTNIRNWAQLNNADGAQYEWSLYTEDGDTYSISCAAVTEEGRILRMYGDNFGMYKSGASVFRLLPVECTEQPTNVLVSAARVAATIAWTNAATCDVKVYLKSNASLVKTLSGVASPVTVTELTETTEYTYTITPVGNVACEVSGEFKTTGPDIDIVEWMTDGVIIQVDKDEALNPKVVIKGEVEHNTGSGVMATELFFSKYFEAHGENKLLAIYNGTGAPIDLSGYEIKSENGTLDLSQFGQTKGTVAPNEEIILVYYDVTDNDKNNIPDYSAEPCAKEQEGYEKWHKLANKSVLAFSGRGSIGLYKDDVLIDVIGSTFPTGVLTKIGKSENGNECEPEDVQLYVDGLTVNDQSSFFCTNGDNIKTPEVESNYAISTNRCLLIRKNTVTSGEDAVATNKAEAGATCGELSSTFKTLCSEWAGFRIGSGKSTSDEIKDATCDGLGYVGGFDYNKYYREFQTLDDSKTLDKFEYNLEENLYKLTIDNVAQYSCLNIQVQINDPVNGTVLTEETAQVPILVTAANTTTDELFSNIIDDDLDASRTRCSTCDVVVLNGATLTKAAAETDNDVNQVRNLYVYPGGQLIVPETGNDYKVNSISFRRVEDAVANAQLSSNLNITASSEKPIYADVRVNAENWHWFTLPYDCNIADVTWVDGTPAKYGVDWFLSTYDGEKRAATQSGGCWAEFHGETIKAGVGYIVGIAGHPTKSKVKYELRFPMSKDVLAQEVAGTDKTVPVYAWGVDEDMRPTHKGWNLVGNPYLDYYQKNKLNTFNSERGCLRLGGKYVLNQSTGYWEDSGEWNGVTGNLPYVVVPINGGWSAYDQVLVSSIDLLPFTAYFVQVGNPETEYNGELKDVLFDGNNRGRASIARRAPSSVSEQEEPVIVGVNLTNSKGESDMTSLVIDDKYTDEYEMNADFFKWFGDYYRYYTRPVLYTIGADKQQRAFNAINEEQAAKPVSMGTYTAQNGEYTFSLERRSDLTRVKEVWLHDATESAYINLMQEDYSFSTGKTDGTGRFTLAVTLHPKSPTDITDGMNGQVYVTSQQRMLYVNNLPQQARVWVYDAVGKLLVNESTNVYQRAYHVGQAGVYFVRVESQNGCETLQAVVE